MFPRVFSLAGLQEYRRRLAGTHDTVDPVEAFRALCQLELPAAHRFRPPEAKDLLEPERTFDPHVEMETDAYGRSVEIDAELYLDGNRGKWAAREPRQVDAATAEEARTRRGGWREGDHVEGSNPRAEASASAAAAADASGAARLPTRHRYLDTKDSNFMVFSADQHSKDIFYIFQVVRKNRDPSDTHLNSCNNGKPWHIYVRWHYILGLDPSKTVMQYKIPETLATLYKNGTQPAEPWSEEGQAVWKSKSRKTAVHEEYLMWDDKWQSSFLLGDVKLTATSKLPSRALNKIGEAYPGGLEGLKADAKLRFNAATEQEVEARSGISGCGVPDAADEPEVPNEGMKPKAKRGAKAKRAPAGVARARRGQTRTEPTETLPPSPAHSAAAAAAQPAAAAAPPPSGQRSRSSSPPGRSASGPELVRASDFADRLRARARADRIRSSPNASSPSPPYV